MNATIFSSTQLAQEVAKVQPLIPAGQRNAVVGTVDDLGAEVVIVAQLGQSGNWHATAAARHDWSTGDNEVGASLVYSW